MSTSYLDRSVREFLELIAQRSPAPGGGAAAAVTVSLAVGLVSMAAAFSPELAEGDRLAEDTRQLRQRIAALADADAAAYQDLMSARAGSAGPRALREALHRATAVPLEIAECGAQAARAAARLAEHGREQLRGDAATGAFLAEAAVRAAARLVEINAAQGDGDPELVNRAHTFVEAARSAVLQVQSLP